MSNVKTNYRIRAEEIINLPSNIVHRVESYQVDSAFAGVMTLSMGGYGIPAWVQVSPRLQSVTQYFAFGSVSIDGATSGSIIYVSLYGWSLGATLGFGAASLNTFTLPVKIFALIASR